jgi:uncharacterized protein HemX
VAQQKPKKPKKPRNYTVSGSSASRSKSSTKAARGRSSKARASKASKAGASKAGASKASAAKSKKPPANMKERMEGLQGWMAEIERKQGRMTYFGGAAALVAIAASAGALYLGVTTKDDSATKDDVDTLQERLDATQDEVKATVEKKLKKSNDEIATLEQTVEDLKKKQAQDAADIASLQSQSNTAKGTGAGVGVGATKGQ